MSKQWMVVGLVLGGLAAGAYAAVKFMPEDQRIEIDHRTPNFHALDVATGDSVTLRDRYQGHVTIVNVWATWCIPCRTEMPALEAAYNQFKDHGFRVASVSIDEGDADAVKAFAQDYKLTFDILHDRTGRIQQLYQTTGVPESFLLDKDGKLVKRVIGAYDWSSVASRKLIARTLGIPDAVALH